MHLKDVHKGGGGITCGDGVCLQQPDLGCCMTAHVLQLSAVGCSTRPKRRNEPCYQPKTQVREYLAQIRAEFDMLMAENEARPEPERLPRSAFEIDVGLRDMVAEVRACEATSPYLPSAHSLWELHEAVCMLLASAVTQRMEQP